jgi:hypothetical protein
VRSVIIAGSRTLLPSVDEIDAALKRIPAAGLLWVPEDWEEIVCGMASGADLAGKAWAEAKGKRVHCEPVTQDDYDQHGGALGPKMRNRRMAERADGAIIFWDGRSGGSADMCCRMVARDKPVAVIPWPRRVRS